MLFNLSAMTANPLSCIKSRPVRDFRLPVERKYSRLLPMIPVSSNFFRFSIERSFVSSAFEAVASLMIFALTYDKVSSSFYLSIMRYRCPGSKAS